MPAPRQSDDIRIGEEVLVYHKEGRAAVPADMCRLRNGMLLVSFRDATHHTAIDGKIAMVRSQDGGKTWGDYDVIRDTVDPLCDFRDPSICELTDGTLVLTFFAWRGTTHKGNWDGSQTVVIRSFDGGATWGEEQVLSPAPFDFMLTTERCIELPTGRLLMPVHGGSRAKGVNNGAVWCSDDRGRTWRHLATVHTQRWPEGSRWSMETALVNTKRGRLVAISRTNRHMLQAVSNDTGITWERHRELIDTPPETQPSLNCLHDGRLMLAYGDRGPLPRDPSYPCAVVAQLSEDDGESWGEPIILRGDLPHWDMGYPTSVEVAPGRIVTVYWWSLPAEGKKWPDGWDYRLSCRHWQLVDGKPGRSRDLDTEEMR